MDSNDVEKQIDCLVKAKEICEAKLGIGNNVFVYFEIIKALGEACEELNKKDEALLWYEEGIIKGLPYLETDVEPLHSYFKDIRNYLADIYEKKGNKDIAKYWRTNKPLDFVGSFDYAIELFHQAIQLNKENKYCEAIKLLDDAKSIFKRYGNEGKEMMQPLYRAYLLCYTGLGDTKKIDALLKSKTRTKTMFNDGKESFLVGDMFEVISSFITIHYDVKTAEYYYQKLLNNVDKNNQKDLNQVKKIGDNINFFKTTYALLDSLETIKTSVPILSYEWGISSLKQANLLMRIHRFDDANMLCEQIYKMSVVLKEDPQNLHWFVLKNLANYYNQKKDLDKTVQYSKEQLIWLDSKNIRLDAEERGWIYNQLGIAYLNGELYKEATDMLTKAENILLPIYGHQSQEYATILHNKGRLAQLVGNLDNAKQYLEEAVKIQVELDGKAMDRTLQYLDEVNHSIKVRL
jgi:tetratricopeptide (TPR) repeat protein